MTTILNSIAIICLSIAFALYLIKFHKPIKFVITEEELERHNKLQKFLKESRKAGEEFRKKTERILSNVSESDRNSES